MSDNYNKEVPDGMTPLDEALATKLVGESREGSKRRYNCGSCEGMDCVEKDMNHVYTNKELGLKLVVPAHVCSNCGSTVYETNDYKNLLQAEEVAHGRPWVKVVIKNGRISKHSMH